MSDQTNPPGHADGDATHDQLERALDLALGGFRALDQGLELSDGGLVHLLGADADGSLVLVLLVSEDDEETSTRALEALDLALEHGHVVHHHLTGGPAPALGLDPARPPRLLLVGEAFELARLRRLTTLCHRAERAELFELRTLRTGAGDSLYLHRLAGTAPAVAERVEPRRSLAPRSRGFGEGGGDLLELLTQRMRGLDPHLEMVDTPAVRRWLRSGAADLVEARAEGDGSLTVRLAGSATETLRNARDLDAFVERVVARYLSDA